MGIWIRNQYGTSLRFVQDFYITHYADKNIYEIYTVHNNEKFMLGDYETGERARKVLDEIQDAIIKNYPLVYQMPYFKR